MRKYKILSVIFCILFIIVTVFYIQDKIAENDSNKNTKLSIKQQVKLLESVESELRKTNTPVFQSYGNIKEMKGMNQLLTLSQIDTYQKYGNYTSDMLGALIEAFNTFLDNGLDSNIDREFLADQVHKVLNNLEVDNLSYETAQQVKLQILNETTEYYESMQLKLNN